MKRLRFLGCQNENDFFTTISKLIIMNAVTDLFIDAILDKIIKSNSFELDEQMKSHFLKLKNYKDEKKNSKYLEDVKRKLIIEGLAIVTPFSHKNRRNAYQLADDIIQFEMLMGKFNNDNEIRKAREEKRNRVWLFNMLSGDNS